MTQKLHLVYGFSQGHRFNRKLLTLDAPPQRLFRYCFLTAPPLVNELPLPLSYRFPL